ncbi:MAG: hypothetical protein NTY46_16670 [Candidatus Sumerlaeota bacterium]|nr:hypothetical protein [Candidatus Sumerlaeota bacterium]
MNFPWFSKKKTVKDLAIPDLETERIRLEEEERRILARVEKAEDEKKRLFQKGASEASKRQKILIARKMKEIDEQARENEMRAGRISKQLRVVNRLIVIKRNEKKLKESNVWSTISSMSADELETMLTHEVVRDTAEAEKQRALLEVIEADPRMTQDLGEEEDVLKLVEKMEQAGESGEIDESYSEASGILDSKNSSTE